MAYYFLPTDFEKLNEQIQQIVSRIKEIGRIMGESCREGAETYHDNFAYEDGERQQQMWSVRFRELVRVRDDARVVNPEKPCERVGIGCTVVVLDMDTDEEKTLQIGSYMTFNGNASVSYNAPLARMLLGGSQGDIRKGVIAGRKRCFEIVEIR